jgi:hypothetical protein
VGSYEHNSEGMGSVMMTMENFQPPEWLLASQGVCSMKSVNSTNTEIQLHSTSQSIKSDHQQFCNMLHTNIFIFPIDFQ